MPILFYTHSLCPRSTIAEPLQSFAHALSLLPLGIDLRIESVPNDCLEELFQAAWKGTLEGMVALIEQHFPSGAKLLLECPPDHPLAAAARGRLPHALWGISLRGRLSIVYHVPDPFIVWHEALHLLGAQDHYDPTTFRTQCDLPTCIMQYAPSASTVAPDHWLCERTRSILLRVREAHTPVSQ